MANSGSTSPSTTVPSDNNSICPDTGTDGSTVFSGLPAIFTAVGSSASQLASTFQQPGIQKQKDATTLAQAQLTQATTQQIFTEVIVASLIIAGIYFATRKSN